MERFLRCEGAASFMGRKRSETEKMPLGDSEGNARRWGWAVQKKFQKKVAFFFKKIRWNIWWFGNNFVPL